MQINLKELVVISRRVRKIPKNDKLTSLCMFVRPSAWNNLAPTGLIFIQYDIRIFFKKSVERFYF